MLRPEIKAMKALAEPQISAMINMVVSGVSGSDASAVLSWPNNMGPGAES